MRKLIIILAVLSAAFSAAAKAPADSSLVFNRGIGTPSSCFIPKGTKGVGIFFSYNTYDAGNSSEKDPGFQMLGSLVSGLKGSLNTMSCSPSFSYFIKDNLSVGARFDYSKTVLDLPNASLGLGDDLKFDLKDMNFAQNTYAVSATLRDYIPIQNSKRFALFAEGRLSGAYSESKNFKDDEGLKHGTFQQSYKLSLGLVPGVCAFITDVVAFEVSVGLVGVNYQKTVQIENQVTQSVMTSSGANLKINLFSLSFGINFYILDSRHRPSKV